MIRLSPLAFALAALAAAPAAAKEYVVHMKNSGAAGMMAFEPMVVNAKPGDTVRFVPTDASHNAETILAIWPAGAPAIRGAINKEVTLSVTKAGIYGIKCQPHYAMGMVALVIAGNANRAAAQAATLPPLAAKRLKPALAAIQ